MTGPHRCQNDESNILYLRLQLGATVLLANLLIFWAVVRMFRAGLLAPIQAYPNHRKMVVKWWLNGGLMMFNGIYPPVN